MLLFRQRQMTVVLDCLLGEWSSCYCWHVCADIWDSIRKGSSQNVAIVLQLIIPSLSRKRFILVRVVVNARGENEAVFLDLRVW